MDGVSVLVARFASFYRKAYRLGCNWSCQEKHAKP